MTKTQIFSDGSCLGNPGRGGWAALILLAGEKSFMLSGCAPETTNNRMELTAIIEGLRALPAGSEVEVFSDSQYATRGMTEWLPGWRQKNWKTASGKAIKNRDLWQGLEAATARHSSVRFQWIKAHNRHPENEQVDQKARQCAAQCRQ